MQKKTIFSFCFLIACYFGNTQNVVNIIDIDKQFRLAADQYKGMLQSHQDLTQFPQSSKPNGQADNRTSDWWCSGFFSGALWYLYEYSKDTTWKNAADKWTKALDKEKLNTSTHDLGFIMYCSYGNGYRLTKNKDYLEPLITGASSLATRFDSVRGVIRSWDSFNKVYDFPVIIDNMMNLEYLLFVAKYSKNKRLYQLAISHADKTLKNHFRKDFSSYHVVCYDQTGKVIVQKTHQGAHDTSAWARGQGWALYGYTMMYRETNDKKYLQQAESIAKYIINHSNLTNDKIPYWDFYAPNIPNEERDASAAAIFASALLELSEFSPQHKSQYIDFASQILISLSSNAYTAKSGENNHFILKHSVGHKPAKSEIDTPIIYADYYYLEALLRYKKLVVKQ